MGIGTVAWIPNSNRIIVGDLVGPLGGTMTLDGADYQPFPTEVLEAVALPDGQRALISAIPSAGVKLAVIDVDGSNLMPQDFPGLSSTGYVRDLALSPNDQYIAFTKEHLVTYRGGGRIWLLDTNTFDYQPLGPDNTYDYGLAWSPDSQTIAFSRWDSYPDIQTLPHESIAPVSGLWLIHVKDGQEQQLLSSEGLYAHWSPHWLPDGSGLLFLSDRGGEPNIWFIRPDGSELQQLTRQGSLCGEIAVRP
jgi:Tol biopolymer transport system component